MLGVMPAIRGDDWRRMWPVAFGLALLYLPTWWDLAHTLWSGDEQAHGPLVLAVALFLSWQRRHVLLGMREDVTRPVPGWTCLLLGLLCYALGRSQEILLFEVGSKIPVLCGVVLITSGGRALRVLAFPILFLAFMVPLPGAMVDALTGPLKQFISSVAEKVLYLVGYPIGRSGVMLTIGHYQLLVADACSGLNSLFSLSALGLLYLYLMRHAELWRNAILLASVVPIAIVANVLRVILLILITYHFGDAAGQGFAHGLAGMVLFLAALLFLFLLDGALGVLGRRFA